MDRPQKPHACPKDTTRSRILNSYRRTGKELMKRVKQIGAILLLIFYVARAYSSYQVNGYVPLDDLTQIVTTLVGLPEALSVR